MNTKEREEFGNYIKRLREEANLSLREAEQRIGISNSYLYQIERGDRNPPKMDVLRKMAEAYNVTLASLLVAAKIQEQGELDIYYKEDELERAFEYVRKDKRFKFGSHMNGSELTPEAKRFIVEMYQRFNHRVLIGNGEEGNEQQ